MNILSTVLLVLFIIICIVLILLVLLQNEEGDSIGGLFAGSSNSAFGAHSSNILAKITQFTVFLFFLIAFSLAFVHRSNTPSFENDVQEQQMEQSKEWWKNTEATEDNSTKVNSSETTQNTTSVEDKK